MSGEWVAPDQRRPPTSGEPPPPHGAPSLPDVFAPPAPYAQPDYPLAGYPPAGDPPAGYPQPGYAQPGHGYPESVRITPVAALSVGVIALSCVLFLLQVISAATSWQAGSYYADLPPGTPMAETDFLVYDVIAIPTGAIILAAFVVTSMWLYTIRTNVDQIDRTAQRRGKVWAWLGWVIPVVSLWFPYQVVADAAKTSKARTPLTGLWWATWLVYSLVGSIADQLLGFGFDAPNPDLAAVLGPAETTTTVAMAFSLVLWIMIVRGLTAAQTTLAAQNGSEVWPTS